MHTWAGLKQPRIQTIVAAKAGRNPCLFRVWVPCSLTFLHIIAFVLSLKKKNRYEQPLFTTIQIIEGETPSLGWMGVGYPGCDQPGVVVGDNI